MTPFECEILRQTVHTKLEISVWSTTLGTEQDMTLQKK